MSIVYTTMILTQLLFNQAIIPMGNAVTNATAVVQSSQAGGVLGAIVTEAGTEAWKSGGVIRDRCPQLNTIVC